MDYYFIGWAQTRGEIILQPTIEYDEQKIKIGKYRPSQSFPVKIAKGNKFYDVCYFADPFNFSISERLKNIFLENGFTGWGYYPLAIEGSAEQYYGFTVLGTCGPIKKPSTPGWVIGYEFDLKTWDGSDFFCPQDTLHTFFTDKVKYVLEKNKVSNFGIFHANVEKWYNTSDLKK